MKLTHENIQNHIHKYLPVRKSQKDKYGEVFTPPSLINEMLDKLPAHIWNDPTLKWLDPANGVGNFPLLIFQRLMERLTSIPRENREKHIIHNMLYMIELNPDNVEKSRDIFGNNANIYCGSFFDDAWKTKFRLDKFDVIIYYRQSTV